MLAGDVLQNSRVIRELVLRLERSRIRENLKLLTREETENKTKERKRKKISW
jgi:hypothetical protein